MSFFWSAWIIGLTLTCTTIICWLLFANRKTSSAPDTTTGHIYDGIEEYDNPLPAWWFYLFVITILFAVGYLIAYPGLGAFQGLLHWSQEKQLATEVASADAEYGPLFARYAALPIAEISKDPKALKMGQRLFANNCAQCHGADARGSFGFPNLADNDWLYGGSAEQIETTIGHGRSGGMPPWEAALGNDGIQQVVAFVTTLSGRPADATLAAAGQQKFALYCVACHGADGKGNQQLGAPNLTDDIWLYGGSPVMLQQTVRNGRSGQMPAWIDRLGAERVHLLAAYVYSLSHTNAPTHTPTQTQAP
ncbi:MAG TPA: cytochrome-c oxidase, cbb3-type subunit III [Spongiibacteraceae bacterium]|nr:cytochrome-c oxidase, cbb3-type subunit III [Spongiibacteraceae bacterium]